MIVLGKDEIVIPWIVEKIPHADNFTNATSIGIARDDKLIGGVLYSNFRDRDLEMSAAGDGNWLNRSSLYAIFSYPFLQLGCARVTAIVPKRNKPTRKFIEKVGWKLEGTHRHAFPNDDACSYGMLKNDCRWIKEKSIG
jgi:RimJ/RimL family protein N-acetyltransferase